VGPAGAPSSTGPDAKRGLRAGVRADRRALDDGERAALDADLAAAGMGPGSPLAALTAGSVVAVYDSLPTEPGTRGLREALAARGVVVVLPVVTGPDAPLAWRVDGGADGGSHRASGIEDAAVVLLPALAVDGAGTRLGQGGGHYDRTLALLSPSPPTALSAESAVGGPLGSALSAESAQGRGRPLLAAVVGDRELLPAGALPREPHDVPVDAALTPSGWHDLR